MLFFQLLPSIKRTWINAILDYRYAKKYGRTEEAAILAQTIADISLSMYELVTIQILKRRPDQGPTLMERFFEE